MLQELKWRIVTGLVMACSFILISWIGGIWFRLWTMVMSLCIYYEWKIITGSVSLSLSEKILGLFTFFLVFFMIITGFFKSAFFLLMLYSFIDWMISIMKNRAFWRALGVVYSGLPSIALSSLRGDDAKGCVIVFFVLSVVWATDIFAYFIGRFVGGPKIAPKISPRKTWSGSIGGLFCGVGVGVALLSFFCANCFELALAVSILLSVSCQLGDLFESYIKRYFGIKQSGWLLPGHGGVMDRVDGLVFSCFLMSAISFFGIATEMIGVLK
ncbi:phosphatidate cytidylyltransferase [Candidatus Liberibacter asiaticus]|uniref:Phosphatidate cytidylyltransferase n=3 Tax=Liberibacter asiaticus TaxID=34021 RepID=C6XFU4_LIBAP|nr:phosphatidate cytidylyltransferase [Candidatus Liberibacter asiaticus]AGH16790.1 phosphatidate cytidylyltransferase protein [Candidatus Liberibacter asiaticus str. gxpsy]ACT57247.1 phosphatidate cytidylyltransferase protein [Candidatus Liberibacter asiaticus str. psy62]ALK07154.1 CDP-archaeol synthase [Candidatus Liberibacter asiaticus]ASK52631.1 phosphatidate cytidylyltransferase [Candidatus Liberibacter asiaticus]AWL13956.1 CDP-archaeol synthase [Candidatus Liberibacter asiaticus]